MLKEKKISMRELAKRAEVSSATVSRVLNGKIDKNNVKYTKVMELINKYNYTRKRKLPENKYRILCINLYKENNMFTHAFLYEQELARQCTLAGYELLIIHETEEIFNKLLLKEYNVHGVIYIHRKNINSITNINQIVAITCLETQAHCSSVGIDYSIGVIKSLIYLKERGHQRIAFFCESKLQLSNENPRQYCLQQNYKAAEVAFIDELIWQENFKREKHVSVIKKAAKYYATLKNPPTALLIADAYAPSFYEELRKNGFRIPEDISIIGFDNFPMGGMLSPPLTTIKPAISKTASEAIRILIEKINNPSTCNVRVLVEPELIERDSVKILANNNLN